MNMQLFKKGFRHFLIKRCSPWFWIRKRWLDKTEQMSIADIKQLQLSLLQKLVRHCYLTVPFYKKLMDNAGFGPESIKTLGDLTCFPIISKADVLAAKSSIYSTKFSKIFLNTAYTGGTTGTPLKIIRDLFSIADNHAFYWRQKQWGGMRLSDKCAYLTGSLLFEPDDQSDDLHAYDPFMKELVLSTYHLTKKSAINYADVIQKKHIKYLDAYPSAAYLLAKNCLELKIGLQLESVFTSSEVLTSEMKDTIERAFNCKVFDYYGGAERTVIIHTCQNGSYHIIPEYGITELLPSDDGEANKYKVISTGFWNTAMPLIRYDTGDYVIKTDRTCPCGRSWVIDSIFGRKADVIKTPSGREFGAAILTHLLYGTDHIVESQIVQDAIDHIYIDYVPSKLFNGSDQDAFTALIKQHLPSELKVDFRIVETIPKTASGKLKPVISLIS